MSEILGALGNAAATAMVFLAFYAAYRIMSGHLDEHERRFRDEQKERH